MLNEATASAWSAASACQSGIFKVMNGRGGTRVGELPRGSAMLAMWQFAPSS